MSESSSDTESSCGWTVISNEGSDIETLGAKSIVDDELEEAGAAAALEQPGSPQGEKAELLDECCLDVTLKADETGPGPQVRKGAGLEDHVTLCSSSDHSDIITLADSREAELGTWEEPAAREEEAEETEIRELYLGSSSSSQYTFSTAETRFPSERPVRRDSSSTEDEAEPKAGALMRRRRPRKNTAGSEPDGQQEQDEGDEDLEEEAEEHREARLAQRRQSSRTLNKCILLALVIAFSMGFGHFHGTVQIQERQRMVQRTRLSELSETRELHQCRGEQDVVSKDVVDSLREDLEEKQDVVTSLTGIMDKITKENQNLRAKEAELQVQRRDLLAQLQQAKSETENRQKELASENQALKSTLEREEASVSAMRDELGRLRAQIRELEEKETGADSALLENRRLKVHLLEEQNRIQSCLIQKEGLRTETHVLRKELYEEKEATEKLKEELEEVTRRESGAQEDESQTEELQARLQELEKKLSFEQQRSDLWERLYVESRDERPKGDKQVTPGRSKDGIMGAVKETFDAVKNSTKEFVHHHKEQIKKAKEAVKENLRKFSDSVKSTFRHLKVSTSNVFDNIRRPQEKRNERKDSKEFRRPAEEPWQQHHQPPHRHPHKSTADAHSKPDAQKDRQRSAPQGCTGVFDCAYQESMSLFNKAMEPIRADEFHQLLRSYLQREVGHFHHWRELNSFIDSFFRNGLFIHDQMLFTDFVSGVEDYLEDMDEYRGTAGDVFMDLSDYIYRHLFGDTYRQRHGRRSEPHRPHEGPPKRECQRHQRKHQHSRPGHPRDRKWARSGRASDRHFADVKIELGPMPFDPKY